jgi:uncharacterized protein
MIIDRNVQIAMRDGTSLLADIYRPEGASQRPVVLTRTCYTKVAAAPGQHPDKGAFWTAHGYIYIVQDVRGRGDSGGTFYPLVHEREDGSDTIDWIVSQPWSDGRVVMSGASYLGWTQVYAACSHNPHLKVLVPTTTPPDPDRHFPLSFGMLIPGAATWMAMMDGRLMQDVSADDVRRAYAHRPVIEFDRLLGRRSNAWRDWVGHAVRDEYWEQQSYQRALLESTQPMLHITGWYDDCLLGALENFAALSRRTFNGKAPMQRLIVGPWLHVSIGQRRIGNFDYGAGAELNLNQLQRDWFDACLNDREWGTAPVQLFVMGRNAWLYEKEWPIARTEYVPYYLHSGGRANTRHGDGTLSIVPPRTEPADQFEYDPDNPVPYTDNPDFKQVGGPDDYAALELRPDVLVYTGPVLERPLLICGPLRVKLYAATSAKDTDWMAKVLDVYPDGRAIRLYDGAIRARFRQGHHREEFIPPGEAAEYEIDCWATCIDLQPGHRLRLEITSSALYKYDLNLNTGGPIGRETQAILAQQTVYHDAAHPSHLLLPVLRS